MGEAATRFVVPDADERLADLVLARGCPAGPVVSTADPAAATGTTDAEQLVAGALHRHRRRRHVRHRADHARHGPAGQRQRRQGLPAADRAGRRGGPGAGRARPAARRGGPDRGGLVGRPGHEPRAGPGRGSACRCCTVRQALAAVSGGHQVVAVAGTNGKTTTTSMLTVLLQQCGRDPSFSIGGELTESGTNAAPRQRRRVRARGRRERRHLRGLPPTGRRRDERRSPTTSTSTAPRRRSSRVSWTSRAASGPAGCWWPARTTRVRADSPTPAAAEGIRVRTYGRVPGGRRPAARARADERGASFEVWDGGELRSAGPGCSVPGRHNALNALAAWTASVERRRTAAGGAGGGWGRSPAPAGGSSHAAAPAACGCSTTTRTTRARSPQRCRPPARWPAPVGCWRSSSRTSTAAPGTSPRSSARRSGWPTRSS